MLTQTQRTIRQFTKNACFYAGQIGKQAQLDVAERAVACNAKGHGLPPLTPRGRLSLHTRAETYSRRVSSSKGTHTGCRDEPVSVLHRRFLVSRGRVSSAIQSRSDQIYFFWPECRTKNMAL